MIVEMDFSGILLYSFVSALLFIALWAVLETLRPSKCKIDELSPEDIDALESVDWEKVRLWLKRII